MLVRGTFGQYWVAEEPFAAGGAARLFRCYPEDGYVYKQYRVPVDDPAEIARLHRLRNLGRRVLLDTAQPVASTPESSINWPVDTVEHAGVVAGVILPEIPARFFTPGGSPRGLDFLILARAEPPPARVRLAVLIRLAEIFAWLECQGLVHGDFSQRNVVWCPSPEPGAYLIDTDGLRPRDPTPRVGLATPGWTDPRLAAGLIPAHDHHSDAYALALAMYRGLLLNPGYLERRPTGEWPKPSALPPDLDPAVRDLLEAALGSPLDPSLRATAREWVQILLAAYVTPAGFDAAQLAVLDRHAQHHRDHHDRQRAAAPPPPPPRPPPPPGRPAPAPIPKPSSSPLAALASWAAAVAVVLFVVMLPILNSLQSGGSPPEPPLRARPIGDGGPATEAEVDNILDGLALDTAGNLYIAERIHDLVRRVNPAGIISTVAGTGENGFSGDGGFADSAQLNHPTGLAIDAAGNLYIADDGNRRIRRVSPAGIITTVAGTGEEGFSGDGGLAIKAKLSSFLSGLAVDAQGNLYIADGGRVRRVDPAGTITTVVETTMNLEGLAFDAADNLYLAEDSLSIGAFGRVRRVDRSGASTLVAGTQAHRLADGRPAPALGRPWGVAVDAAGNVYIADHDANRVSRVDPAGLVTIVAGTGQKGFSGDGGPATAAQLYGPTGLAVDAAGNLYIAGTGAVRKVDPGGIITTVAGKRPFWLDYLTTTTTLPPVSSTR